MGLFDRKRLTTATQVLHMVEDTPDIIKQSVMSSLLGDRDMVPDILDTINNSLSTSINKYHRYARTKYTNGLPEGTIGYEAVPAEKIQAALDLDRPPAAGKANGVRVAIMDKPSTDDLCFDWLAVNRADTWYETQRYWREDVGYGPDTLCLFISSAYVSRTQVKFTYNFNNHAGNPVWRDRVINVTEYPLIMDELYYNVEYNIYDLATGTKEGHTRYWQYLISSNKYPDMQPDHSENYSQFMPIVPIRVNNKNYADESLKDTPLFKTSKYMLDILEIDFEQLANGINANPDIKDIDHGYFVIGVNPRSTKVETNDYLFRFFSDLEGRSGAGEAAFNQWWYDPQKTRQPPINTLEIRDATYNTVLCWNYIRRTITRGTIGKVGEVKKVIDANHGTLNVSLGDPASPWVSRITIENPANTMTLTKQVDKDYYVELVVCGLMFSNRIYGTSVDYISTLASKEGEEIIIPLNLSIFNDLPKLNANVLLYDSLLMVFNAFQWTKLKWYQTGFFKIVTIVVSIAITIISVGGLSGLSASLIGLASAGVSAMVVAIGKVLLTSIVVQVGFKFAAEHLGIEFALILASVMAAYGILGSDSMFGLPNATDLIQIANLGFKGIQAQVTEEMIGIQTAAMEFAEEAENQMKELEDMTSELSPQVTLDPIGLYTNVGMLPNETASAFLSRSLMTDTVTPTLDSVTSFVDNSLRLDFY